MKQAFKQSLPSHLCYTSRGGGVKHGTNPLASLFDGQMKMDLIKYPGAPLTSFTVLTASHKPRKSTHVLKRWREDPETHRVLWRAENEMRARLENELRCDGRTVQNVSKLTMTDSRHENRLVVLKCDSLVHILPGPTYGSSKRQIKKDAGSYQLKTGTHPYFTTFVRLK